MSQNSQNRLDPASIPSDELEKLGEAFAVPGHVLVVDDSGNQTVLPETFYQHLIQLVQLMREGQTVSIIPEDETLSTQAAANFLGMSRQYFVELLSKEQIPFHKVGSHRRVYFRDLIGYQKRRDEQRKGALDDLRKEVSGHDLYFPKTAQAKQ